MVEDTSRRERFWFRFTSLSDKDLKTLQDLLPTIPFTIRKKGDVSVVSFEIVAGMDLEGLYTFLAQVRIDPSTYSVWISVVTSSDHSGVSLPPYVRDLVRNTSGGIDFSFTAALGDS
jgi:hypothetical protein